MQQTIDTFKLNIESVKQLDIIYQYLEQENIKNLDLSEILRAEIVLAVSALDHFISDILHIGLVKTFEEEKPLTTAFSKFQVDMKTLVKIVNEPSQKEKSLILGEYIRKFNEGNSYQKPSNIANSLKLLGVNELWNKLSGPLSIKNPDEIQKELENIVTQRHKIAHEADFDHLTQKKRPRDKITTFQAVQFIERLCIAIHEIVSNELETLD